MAYSLNPTSDNCYKGTTCLVNRLGIRDEKILPHFSEGRLCSLVADIHRKEKKKCYNSYILN